MGDSDQPRFNPDDPMHRASDCHRDPQDEADELGLIMFKERDGLLMLDLDDPERDMLLLEEVGQVLEREAKLDFSDMLSTKSKSGEGVHVYIRCKTSLTPTERLLVQACLGSDRKREAFGLVRRFANLKVPHRDARPDSVLFETPQEAVRVDEWMAQQFEDHVRRSRP